MKIHIVKIIGNLLIFAGLILMAVCLPLPEDLVPFFGIPGLILALGGFVFFFFFWRCPVCHTPLPFYGSVGMTHCPYCGNELK